MADLHYRVYSESLPGHFRVITGHPVRNGYFWECSCPGYAYKGTCSHIRKVRHIRFSNKYLQGIPEPVDPKSPYVITRGILQDKSFAALEGWYQEQYGGKQRKQHEVLADSLGVDL